MRERIAQVIRVWAGTPDDVVNDEYLDVADMILSVLDDVDEVMVEAGVCVDRLRSDKAPTWHDRHWMRQCWKAMLNAAKGQSQ